MRFSLKHKIMGGLALAGLGAFWLGILAHVFWQQNGGEYKFLGFTALGAFLAGLAGYALYRVTARGLIVIRGELEDSSGRVAAASRQVASASQSLARGAQAQAASLQQAAAAVREVTGLVQKNASDTAEAARLVRLPGQHEEQPQAPAVHPGRHRPDARGRGENRQHRPGHR